MIKNKFIGSGITFPIQLNADGRPDFVNDMSNVWQAISLRLITPNGNYLFDSKFQKACRLY
jgi:hypothetical protein